jgi:exopolysaccharide biosynthesis polyprenyl glycosylphosphotransferase
MSTRESVAHREVELLTPTPQAVGLWSTCARIWAWPLLNKSVHFGGDLFAIFFAHALALHLVEHFLRDPVELQNPSNYPYVYTPFFVVIMYLFKGYKDPELRRPEEELEGSSKAVGVTFLGLALLDFVAFRSEVLSGYLIVTWFTLTCVVLVSMRFILRAIQEKLWKSGLCRRRTVLAGSPASFREHQRMLFIQRHNAYDVVGVLTDAVDEVAKAAVTPHLSVLGSLERWEESILANRVKVLIVTCPPVCGEKWMGRVLRRCKQLRVDVEFYSGAMAATKLNYEHDEYSGCFRFYAQPQWSLAIQRAAKRGIDIVIGLIGSAVTLLLIPVIFVLVKIEDRGPLFYRSAYLGQDGSMCYYLKFRTMREDADKILETDEALRSRFRVQQKLVDDPRITRIGRFLRKSSLDEFPQFFSVLFGDLTFVGPRTIRQEEAVRYGPYLEKLFSAKPGVTGFWQVMGRQTTTYEDRVEMDMFYVERWSIWLDLVIIAKTFWTVLKAEGAH